jgi:hypothetical protein
MSDSEKHLLMESIERNFRKRWWKIIALVTAFFTLTGILGNALSNFVSGYNAAAALPAISREWPHVKAQVVIDSGRIEKLYSKFEP